MQLPVCKQQLNAEKHMLLILAVLFYLVEPTANIWLTRVLNNNGISSGTSVLINSLAMSGRPPPSIDGMTSLKIDNLSYRTDSESLRRKFEKYGDIGDVYVPKDKYGDTRGFAFVRFYDKRDAEDAIDAMDGKELDGRDLRVDIARHDRPQPCKFDNIFRNKAIYIIIIKRNEIKLNSV